MGQRTLLVVQAVCILFGVAAVWIKPALGEWLGRCAPVRGVRWLAARPRLAIAFVGVCGFLSSVFASAVRGFPIPYAGDELGYLLAADTFAHGRITNPTPPNWQHFETLNTIFQPSYMSKFPPAQGLILALGQLIGGHAVAGVWLSIGLLCASVTWLLWAIVSPRWAVVGGLISVFDLGFFSYWSASYWGGAMAGIGGCLLLGSVLRSLQKPLLRLSLVMGLGIAVVMLSRPYEGGIYTLCCLAGGTILWKRKPLFSFHDAARKILLPLGIISLLLFLFIVGYNTQITGSWKKMPYAAYEESYGIAPLFVFQKPRPVPDYRHETFRTLYLGRDMGWYTQQQDVEGLLRMSVTKLRTSLLFYWSIGLILPLLACFVLARRSPHFGYILGIVAGVLAASLIGVFWSPHYIAPLTGTLILLPTFGIAALWHWKPQNKLIGRAISGVITASVVLIPSFSQSRILESPPEWRLARNKIVRGLEQKGGSHLVLVSYNETHDPHNEWVFNRADIPNSKLVWARLMSQRNNENLLAAYPNRSVWLLEPDADPPRLTPYFVKAGTKNLQK